MNPSFLQGHCQDCVHKLVACSNPKLIPADSDIHEPFEMVAGNHCGEETTVNRLEVSRDRSVADTWSDIHCFLLY